MEFNLHEGSGLHLEAARWRMGVRWTPAVLLCPASLTLGCSGGAARHCLLWLEDGSGRDSGLALHNVLFSWPQ